MSSEGKKKRGAHASAAASEAAGDASAASATATVAESLASMSIASSGAGAGAGAADGSHADHKHTSAHAKKGEESSDSDEKGDATAADNKAKAEKLSKEQAELLALLKQPGFGRKNRGGSAVTADDTATAPQHHKFWDTQPVPKLAAAVTDHGPIDPVKSVDEIRKEPYALPSGFFWVTVDIRDGPQLKEMYELLSENYVEDDDMMFRFNYSAEFLLWALTPPGYFADWHVGVRNAKNKLVACITGVPCSMQVYHNRMTLCEINFLCVHKKLRAKRLAPVLIKEVTRRVNLQGIFQAAYTAGVLLPKPVSSCQYWHRSLHPQKLIEIGFSRLAPRMTMTRTNRLFALPAAPKLPGMRQMEARDVPAACKLLNSYLEKFKLHPVYSEDDFAHWFCPRPGVIDTFVVADPASGELTDMTSFYHLPSTVIGHPKHKTLLAVYSYYHVPGKHSMEAIMEDSLILAKQKGADVYNCLDLMENESMLKSMKFGPGDGNLQYYLYNWQCPEMPPRDIGLVLL